MATATYQFKGGPTADQNSYVGRDREITIDTDKKTIRVHDGQTPGGHETLKGSGIAGTFTSTDGKTITVVNGLITKIQ